MSTLSALYSVLTSPRATRTRIADVQEERLRTLVAHAYANVAYYRRLFDSCGVSPASIRTVDDLRMLPITTKRELVATPPEDLLAKGANPDRLIRRRTSGSSGPSFTTYRSRPEELISELLQLRIRRAFGLRPSDVQVVAMMSDVRRTQSRINIHNLAQRLGIHRTHFLSPLLPPEEFLAQLLEIRPDVILGLTGPLARLAGHVDDRDREVLKPRHVITSGEVLTPAMRRRITEGFNTRVFNKYACAELGHIAYECPETGALHTCDDHLVVEVVRDGVPVGPGERGELVATALHYHTMPFIRYKLADVVTRGESTCACGQPFATIRAIEGRMIDYFKLPDGRSIHPYELGRGVQQAVPWLKEFQVIQERPDLIVANIVATNVPTPEELAKVSEGARQLFQGVELKISFVNELKWDPSGKLRQFRSRVSSDYDDIDWESPTDE